MMLIALNDHQIIQHVPVGFIFNNYSIMNLSVSN